MALSSLCKECEVFWRGGSGVEASELVDQIASHVEAVHEELASVSTGRD